MLRFSNTGSNIGIETGIKKVVISMGCKVNSTPASSAKISIKDNNSNTYEKEIAYWCPTSTS